PLADAASTPQTDAPSTLAALRCRRGRPHGTRPLARRSPGGGAMQIRHILHATDFSPCARQAFDVAVELARLHRARLRIVHVLMPMPRIAIQPLVFVPPPEGAYEG